MKRRRVLKTRQFQRWARETRLTDEVLLNAVSEMEQGLLDADLGGGIVKKRVGLAGRGKRGSARVLLATDRSRWFFVYGFRKNERSNISWRELDALRELAIDLLALSESQIDDQTKGGAFSEIGS
jgi:hypothetical protein